MATSSEPSARRGARPLGRRVDRVPRAAPRRARRAGIHGAGALGCLCFRHGGRTRSPIVPAWFYGPSRKQFTAFGSAGRSGWNGRKAMPFCKGWAPPALELRAGAPAATRSRGALGIRRRPGGPVSRRPLKNPTRPCDTSSSLPRWSRFRARRRDLTQAQQPFVHRFDGTRRLLPFVATKSHSHKESKISGCAGSSPRPRRRRPTR